MQKDSQLEKLKLTIKNERTRREELGTTQKADCERNERRMAELTTQLNSKVKHLKEVELSHSARITEQK